MTARPPTDEDWLDHADGVLDADRRAQLDALLAADPALRARVEDLRAAARALSTPVKGEGDEAAIQSILHAVRAPPARTRGPRAWARVLVVAVPLAAALALVVRGVAPGDAGFTPKGGGAGAEEDRFVGLEFHASGAQGGTDAVAEVLAPSGPALHVRYVNAGDRPFSHLCVFAVDARGTVYWFHPPDDAPGETCVPIAAAPRMRAVPEAVEHVFPRGPLALYGVFVRAPVPSAAVESAVKAQVTGGVFPVSTRPRLLPGAGHDIRVVEVR